MTVSSPQDWNIKIQYKTKRIVRKWVSWIVITKTSYINGLHFIFCTYFQYIQIYNTYIISIIPGPTPQTNMASLSLEPTSGLLYLQ